MTFKYAVIWVFDENRREYTQPTAEQRKAGIIYGERIWKGSWRAQHVVAETSRSWILQGGDKVPKRGANASRFAFSELEVDQWCWDYVHRPAIIRTLYDKQKISVHAIGDIAKMIGYEPRKP